MYALTHRTHMHMHIDIFWPCFPQSIQSTIYLLYELCNGMYTTIQFSKYLASYPCTYVSCVHKLNTICTYIRLCVQYNKYAHIIILYIDTVHTYMHTFFTNNDLSNKGVLHTYMYTSSTPYSCFMTSTCVYMYVNYHAWKCSC